MTWVGARRGGAAAANLGRPKLATSSRRPRRTRQVRRLDRLDSIMEMTKLCNHKLNMKVVKEKVRQVKIKIQALKLTSKSIRTVKLRKF